MRDRVDGLEAAAAAVAALAEDQRRAVDDLDGDESDASRLAAGARSGVLEDSGSGEEPTSCMSTSATSPKNTPPNADLGGFFPAHRGGLLDDSDAAGSESGTFGRGSTGALDACRELQTRWESRDRSLPAIKATEKAVRDGAKGCALEAEAPDGPADLGPPGRALSEDSAEVKRDLAAAARGIGDLEAALGLEYRGARPSASGALAAVRAVRAAAAAGGAPKISFRSIGVGDVALFLPTGGAEHSKAYLAFHHGAPHRYLAPQSIAAIREAHQRYPDFILGRVTRAEPRDVTNDPDSNPYRLPLGTVFHVLAVESL
ncbi:hypothetical protein JL722_10662 [Aureococcus anophagefferens]|nr:hypothetical protein JL722_10662 [Aureococcus anophagefferens]